MSEENGPVLQYPNVDLFLRSLTQIADGMGDTPFELTLLTGGFLVSGRLIGGGRYFDLLQRDLAGPDTDLGELFGPFRRQYPSEEEMEEDARNVSDAIEAEAEGEDPGLSEPPEVKAPPIYVHLAEARFFHPGQHAVPGNRGVTWRGLISAVDGFTFGRLGTEVR